MKIPLVKYPKKSSIGPNGQFWLDCGPKLCKIILRTSSKDFFKLCGMIGDKSLISHGFFAQLLPKIIKCYISGSALKIFLQYGKEQQVGKNHLIEVLLKIHF